MRLFVAIVPPAGILAELAAAVAPLQAAAPWLRWTGGSSRHLTLAFLGEVDESRLAGLTIRLERAGRRHQRQELAIARGGSFPSPARATVLWAGIEADRRALGALAATVAAAARRAGAPSPDEGRTYKPHLTLARCREPADVSGLVRQLAAFAGSPWTAQSMHLIRSHLSGGAQPRYEDIASFALGKPGAPSAPPEPLER